MAYLLIKRIQKLLACGCAGKCCTVIERTSKSTEVEIAFWSPVKCYSQAVHQVDDIWCVMAHVFAEWLVCQKITSFYGIIKMDVWRITLTFDVDRTIDPTLCAD